MTRSTATAKIFRLRPIRALRFALFVVLGLLSAPILSAQTTSTIQGTVTASGSRYQRGGAAPLRRHDWN
jgi:hypothetical protein